MSFTAGRGQPGLQDGVGKRVQRAQQAKLGAQKGLWDPLQNWGTKYPVLSCWSLERVQLSIFQNAQQSLTIPKASGK